MKKFLAFFLSAVLLVSMSAVCAFAADAVTVDGDLSDWTGEWTSVDGNNGYWQSIPVSYNTLAYKYQMTSDDDNLYVAVELNCDAVVGGNGAGTNVRIWINSADDATIYTHFYDVFLEAGEVATKARYNKSKTANDGADIDGSTIDAALVSNGGKTYVEFSVALDEFNGENGFAYYICCSNMPADENACLYYPAVTEGDSRPANLPYSAWDSENEGKFTIAADEPAVTPAPVEEFFVTLVNPADPSIPTGEDGIMYTTENTTNGWWFQVAFAPNGENWEVVEIKLCDGTAATIPEGGFVWALHDTATTTPVTVSYIQGMQVGEVYRIKGLDLANGTVAEDAKIKLYVEGDEWPAEDESDESETTTPEAGDASSALVFAIIAPVAIAGSAVVIKTRK